MMQQAARPTVADALKQSKKQWFSELQKVARKVCFTSYDVTVDESGVLAFYEKAEELLTNSAFSPLVTQICNGLKKSFPWILNTPKELT